MASISVMNVADAAKKFADRASAATPEYKSGLQGSGDAWQRNTAAGEQNYNQGVQAGISRGAFGKGVKSVSGTDFENAAITKGGNRYADGVRTGAPNWATGFQPYADALSKLNLPPRAPKGDPRNMQRATDVAMALNKARVGA